MGTRNRMRRRIQRSNPAERFSDNAWNMVVDLGLKGRTDLFNRVIRKKVNVTDVKRVLVKAFDIEPKALGYCYAYRVNLVELRNSLWDLWKDTGEDPKTINIGAVKTYLGNTSRSTGDEEE